MGEYPDYIDRAFLAMYSGGGYELHVEAFASRWGGLDVENFVQALETAGRWDGLEIENSIQAIEMGDGKDKLIALFALGYMATPQTRLIILPFLHSADPRERWACALCLGEMHDEQALPHLEVMLLEGLSLKEGDELGSPRFWFDYQRLSIPPLLEEWGPPSVIPAMSQAFQTILELEQAGYRDDILYFYQDALTYALGKRGAFGILTGLQLSQRHRRLVVVGLALGGIDARKSYGPNFRSEMFLNKIIRAEVATVLEQRFGLSPHERDEFVTRYGSDTNRRFREA